MARSAEYEVLLRHTVDLQIAVKTDLTALGGQLVAVHIITPNQYQEIRNPHRPVDDRAADLVGYVQNKVRQGRQHYHDFIRALRSNEAQYRDILTILEQSFNSGQPQPVVTQHLPRELLPGGNCLPTQGYGAGTVITVQEVAAKAGIRSMDILDQMCSQQMLLSLAKHCVDWQLVGFHLGLTKADIVAVDGDHRSVEEKRIGMLRRWKETFAFKATYRVFIEALLSCKNGSDALEACKAIASNIGVPAEVQTHSSTSTTFSSSMSDEDFFKWLRSRGMSERDCKTLSDSGITPAGFVKFEEKDFDNIGLTPLGKTLFLRTLAAVKGEHSSEGSRGHHVPPSSSQARERDERIIGGTYVGREAMPTTPAAVKQSKFDKVPTVDELTMLKYTGDKGERRILRIINGACHKWRDIAVLISDDVNVTSVMDERYRGDPSECLRQTFIGYFIEKKPRRYTHDWNGLIELLEDANLETLALLTKDALKSR